MDEVRSQNHGWAFFTLGRLGMLPEEELANIIEDGFNEGHDAETIALDLTKDLDPQRIVWTGKNEESIAHIAAVIRIVQGDMKRVRRLNHDKSK